MKMATKDQSTAQLSREKWGRGITLVFQNGARHVINPTKAFQGDVRGLAEYIAAGEPYRLEREARNETPEQKQ